MRPGWGTKVPHAAWRGQSKQTKNPTTTTKMDAIKSEKRDFPGGTVVKNPPANAGDTGSSPGPGRSHIPQSN